MMRILTLSCEFPPIGGGGAQVVHGLGRALVRRGHEVDVVTMAFGDLPRRETVSGIRVHRVPCLRASDSSSRAHELASYVLSALPVVRRLVRRRHYDVGHTHFIVPDGFVAWVALRRRGVPYIVTAHGSDVPGYNPHRFRLLHELLRPAWRRIVDGAELIACPSGSLERLIVRRSVATPTHTIPNGIDTGLFRGDRRKTDRILVVSRLLRRKGVQYLLRATTELSDGYEVHIVGEGRYRPALERLARELDAPVRFHGWLDRSSAELAELYETSRVFVLPSEAENFPIVLLEAMAAGAAIVTTAGTGCAEVVGDAGVMVPAKDVAALRSAIHDLIRSPDRCARLGSRARRRVEARFSWDAVGDHYLERYRAVLRSRDRRDGPGQPEAVPTAVDGSA